MPQRGHIRTVAPRVLIALGAAVAVLFAAATAVFLMLRVLPGDPVDAMLGPNAQVSDEVRERMRAELGLDRPLGAQYIDFITGLLRGDLGTSSQLHRPVAAVIAEQLGPTVQLTAAAAVLALALVAAGAALGARAGRIRGLLAAIEQIVMATPVFWSGLLLLAVFAFALGWFPVSGARGFASLVLPALTLALPTAALLGQVFRDGVERAEQRPFTESAIARGSGAGRLLLRHTTRHALTGVLPMAAYLLGSLLGGAIVVETVFARPGIGRVSLSAILARDLPLLSGLLLLSVVVFVVLSVAADLAQLWIDPRLRSRAGVTR